MLRFTCSAIRFHRVLNTPMTFGRLLCITSDCFSIFLQILAGTSLILGISAFSTASAMKMLVSNKIKTRFEYYACSGQIKKSILIHHEFGFSLTAKYLMKLGIMSKSASNIKRIWVIINLLLSPLKLSENHRFPDNFIQNRSLLIRLIRLILSSKI